VSARDIAIAITIAVAVVILITMFLAWRRRLRRDSVHIAPIGVPEHAEVLSRHQILYVATTHHERPLERLAIKPLAYRARGELAVTDRGAALCLDGSPTVFLASSALRGIDRATVTIDRVVEPGGLVRVTWQSQDGTTVDSYFRVTTGDAHTLISELQRLIPAHDTGAKS